MDIRNRREICQTARASLASNRGRPQTAVLIYAGISCLLALAATLVSVMLSNQIADTGGLSNLGLRSILSTIQTVLPFVQLLVMMCIGLGYDAIMLDVARNRAAQPRTLMEGFYRFGPLLRNVLLQCCIYFSIAMGTMYLSAWIFMLLPVSDAFYELMEPILTSMTMLDTAMTIDDATLMALSSAITPMMWIFAVVFCIVATPFFYQYRMVSYCLADSSHPGAFAAMQESRQMMRGNRISLLKLDLGFWWYYLLQILITVVCYGDVLLPMAGITLPWSGTVSYFLFYILSLLLQMLVYYFFMNKVNVTYATVYEALRPKPQSGGVTLGNIFDLARDYKE